MTLKHKNANKDTHFQKVETKQNQENNQVLQQVDYLVHDGKKEDYQNTLDPSGNVPTMKIDGHFLNKRRIKLIIFKTLKKI